MNNKFHIVEANPYRLGDYEGADPGGGNVKWYVIGGIVVIAAGAAIYFLLKPEKEINFSDIYKGGDIENAIDVGRKDAENSTHKKGLAGSRTGQWALNFATFTTRVKGKKGVEKAWRISPKGVKFDAVGLVNAVFSDFVINRINKYAKSLGWAELTAKPSALRYGGGRKYENDTRTQSQIAKNRMDAGRLLWLHFFTRDLPSADPDRYGFDKDMSSPGLWYELPPSILALLYYWVFDSALAQFDASGSYGPIPAYWTSVLEWMTHNGWNTNKALDGRKNKRAFLRALYSLADGVAPYTSKDTPAGQSWTPFNPILKAVQGEVGQVDKIEPLLYELGEGVSRTRFKDAANAERVKFIYDTIAGGPDRLLSKLIDGTEPYELPPMFES